MTSSLDHLVLRGSQAQEVAPYRGVAFTPSAAGPGRVTEVSVQLDQVYAAELDRLRERARREGYDAGYAHGLTASASVVAAEQEAARSRTAADRARFEERTGSALAALARAARELDDRCVPLSDEVGDMVASAAFTIVEQLLGRELESARSVGEDAVRRALAFVSVDAPVVVRLHPDDRAALDPAALEQLPPTVTVVADPGVERAGAVAEASTQRVDAQLGAALERVRAVLQA